MSGELVESSRIAEEPPFELLRLQLQLCAEGDERWGSSRNEARPQSVELRLETGSGSSTGGGG